MWCVFSCNSDRCGVSSDLRRGQEDEDLPGVTQLPDSGVRPSERQPTTTSTAPADAGARPADRRPAAASGGVTAVQSAEDTDEVKQGTASQTQAQAFVSYDLAAFLSRHFTSTKSRQSNQSGTQRAYSTSSARLANSQQAEGAKAEGEEAAEEVALEEAGERQQERGVEEHPEEELPAADPVIDPVPVIQVQQPESPAPRPKKSVLAGPSGQHAVSGALQINIDHPGDIKTFYKLGQELGHGAFATVYQAVGHATGAQRAVKRIAKAQDAKNFKALRQEIKILKMLDSPNLIKVFEVFEDKKHIFLVMDLCRGGDLQGVVDSTGCGLAEPDAALAIQQILKGLSYMHHLRICHRDLKGKNVMVTLSMTTVVATGPTKRGLFGQSRAGQYRGKRLMNPSLEDTLRICDFGTSVKFTPGKHMTDLTGTPTHVAPQVLRKNYTEACDMWSCGVILFNLVSGALPFIGNSEQEVLQKVRTGSPKFGKEFVDASGPAMEIVRQMLSEPKSRPSAQKALQHKWMTKLLAKRQAELKPEIVSCLRGYRALNKFKRASLSVMAAMMPEEKLRPARVAFQALDIDSDGTVALEEIRIVMEKMRFKKAEVNETLQAISSVDFNSQGSADELKRTMSRRMSERAKSFLLKQNSFAGDLSMPPFSFSEFLGATLDRSVRLDENLCRAAFNMFDKDGSGKISTDEFLDGSIFGDLSEEEVTQMVEELDVNGDGEIDFAEFMQAVEGQSATNFSSQIAPAIRHSELEQDDTHAATGRLGHMGRGGGF